MKRQKGICIITILIIVLSAIVTTKALTDQTIHQHPVIISSYGETITLYQIGLYERESVSMASQALAQDVVTLVLGIPLLIVGGFLAFIKKNLRGWFLLTGTLAYFLYTYTSYAMLMVFNRYYLFYILIMICSFYGFVLAMIHLFSFDTDELFTQRYPTKALSVYFAIAGSIIMLMWLGRIVPALTSKTAPYGLEHYSTLVIQSLDLGFIVPACFMTTYCLIKKNKWGYMLSAVLVMKMLTMAAAVSAMALNMKLHQVEMSIADLTVFPVIVVVNIIFLGKMLGTMRR